MKTVVLLCSVSGAISGTAERAPPFAPGSNCNSSTKTNKSCEQVGTLFSIRVTIITVWRSPVGTRLTPVRGFGRCEHGLPLELSGSHLARWRNALLFHQEVEYTHRARANSFKLIISMLFQWETFTEAPVKLITICNFDFRVSPHAHFAPRFNVPHQLACGHATQPFSGAKDGFSY